MGRIKADHKRFMAANEFMVVRECKKAGEIAVREANSRQQFRVRTGNLRRNTKAQLLVLADGRKVRVSNKLDYASYLEFGTDPHVIRAKKAKALRFMYPQFSGNYVYRKQVMHPGTKAYKWLWTGVHHSYIFLRVRLLNDMRDLARQF